MKQVWLARAITAFAGLTLVAGTVAAQLPATATSDTVVRGASSLPGPATVALRVDEYVTPLVAMRDFSGTILIARQGSVLLSRGYGFADFALHVTPTETTRFGIGSVGKTITAAAVELLAEQGRIELSDPISRYFPGFVHGDSITITHLLEHSSGLKDYYSWSRYAAERSVPISQEDFLTEVQSQPLDFPPGQESTYSNSGYFVLAAIVERVSGLSYREFIARYLFQPLGMTASGDLHDDEPVSGLAVGYDPGFPPTRLQLAASVSRSWFEGSGSVFSTAQDLYRWLEAIRTQALVNMERLPSPFGWGERTRFGRVMLEQNGRIPIGYASYVGLYPEDDLVVIVLSNIQADVTEQMGVDLAAIALGEGYQIPRLRPGINDAGVADLATLEAFAGRYEISPGFVLTVRAVAKGILLAGPDGAFLPLDGEGADRFFFRPLYVPITFERDPSGKIIGLDWNGQFKAKRLDDFNATRDMRNNRSE